MFTFDATEQINEVSRTRTTRRRTRTTTTQVITRYFGRWPQTIKTGLILSTSSIQYTTIYMVGKCYTHGSAQKARPFCTILAF